ncbi:MAG: hypothetical protein JW749_11455 [Sedimentisphaerales bacterium]|nr:hypothetical protein [Sedimentisphaerales bacterium]
MTNESIKIVLEIINTVAIIAASGVAIYGINAWKKEFSGKRRIELAEDVLALFYEARDAINSIRSPLVFQGEGSTRKSQDDEAAHEKQARDKAYVFYERFDKRKEVFSKLHSKRYQFMARFGAEKTKPFDDLWQIFIDIKCEADQLAEIWSELPYCDEEDKKTLKEQKKEQTNILWYCGRSDPIVPRLEKIILDIEAICKPIIMGKK